MWGECQGSSRYQTQVDLARAVVSLLLPQPQIPVQAWPGLADAVGQKPRSVPAGRAPAWVSEWLQSRVQRSQEKEAKQREKAAQKAANPKSEESAQKSEQKRWARIDQGVAELQQWLTDKSPKVWAS